MLEDPYEQSTVTVGPSCIPFAGEGLFSKRRVVAEDLICLFNGIHCNKNLLPRIIPANHESWSDYRLNLGKRQRLGLPVVYVQNFRI